MNDLEMWLNEVKAYNKDVKAFDEEGIGGKLGEILSQQAYLVASGKSFGLNLSKIKAMLAKVRLTVTMPEEQEKNKT